MVKDREQEIRDIAYRIWTESGRPDGEKMVEVWVGKPKLIKIKDHHWMMAEMEYDMGPDYFRSW